MAIKKIAGGILIAPPTELETVHVSQHFTVKELRCKCCKIMKVQEMALTKLEDMRKLLGEPLRISSAYRCENHNTDIGGAPSSRHLTAEAFDIAIVNSYQAFKYVKAALEIGFYGIGVAETFIHVDERIEPRLWTY